MLNQFWDSAEDGGAAVLIDSTCRTVFSYSNKLNNKSFFFNKTKIEMI